MKSLAQASLEITKADAMPESEGTGRVCRTRERLTICGFATSSWDRSCLETIDVQLIEGMKLSIMWFMITSTRGQSQARQYSSIKVSATRGSGVWQLVNESYCSIVGSRSSNQTILLSCRRRTSDSLLQVSRPEHFKAGLVP